MKASSCIQETITKEGISYKELKEIIITAIEVVDDNSWKVIKDKLVFPIELNNEEIFELIEYFFLEEYDVAVYVDMYYNKNEFLVEGDKHFGGLMFALITIFCIGIFTFIIMASR
ncbi:MAG: hypothetical protein PHD15_06765 [Clostridia bacterium]|nr:hypothetical protein [Clostridia bacterium]MDD4387430.1 hypothetical protein [Clostridia bacterium]